MLNCLITVFFHFRVIARKHTLNPNLFPKGVNSCPEFVTSCLATGRYDVRRGETRFLVKRISFFYVILTAFQPKSGDWNIGAWKYKRKIISTQNEPK